MSLLHETGERLHGGNETSSAVEHLHRYAIASSFAKGKDILDIASGEGYGSFLLSRVARNVTGVDISAEAVTHAAKKYELPNLEYKTGSAAAIPLPDHTVDVVVSFETLEHHSDHEIMMRECKRVLRLGGLFIISTPDKHYYSDVPGYSNPYHVQELYVEEFRSLLSGHFNNIVLLKQAIVRASFVYHEPKSVGYGMKFYSGDFAALEERHEAFKPEYCIIVASDSPLPSVASSLFESPLMDSDLQRRLAHAEALLKNVYSSNTFRIGQFFTSPYNRLKHLLKKSS